MSQLQSRDREGAAKLSRPVVKLLCVPRSYFRALDAGGRIDVGGADLNVFNLPLNFAEPVRRAGGIDDDVTHADLSRETTLDSAEAADGGIRIRVGIDVAVDRRRDQCATRHHGAAALGDDDVLDFARVR